MNKQIEQIKAEIERQYEQTGIGFKCEYDAGHENARYELCKKLLTFIDSIQENHDVRGTMVTAEAYAVTLVIGVLSFPFVLAVAAVSFVCEVGFNMSEMISERNGWDKALVTRTFKTYFNKLKRCFERIADEDIEDGE